MMTNLFSIFDPSTSLFSQLNWINMLLILFIMYHPFWLIPSKINMMWIKFYNMIFLEFKILFKLNYIYNFIIFISTMTMIVLINIMGLFPFIFTSTSSMIISLSLSLPLWMSMMIFYWLNYTKNSLAHMVPLNTPNMLMMFMVIIETISNIIRPMTLAIRLTANMIAGHLLLSLIGSSCSNTMTILLIIIILLQTMLFILEISVAIIQSYVFTILSILYSNE
uniref:ATP synthase subunit a n=1 Tax=Cerceris quinquefasciata TaxID=2026451 RepID=A0A8B0JU62_9HYME|nr:ATP synthase F0 subunit 6 [Cerceris quinquefasciata]QTV22616.1 ATP synthase F0 subunit 6 [Cerceris quinquefasciata]